MVIEHLENARQIEGKFYGGITGDDWPEHAKRTG